MKPLSAILLVMLFAGTVNAQTQPFYRVSNVTVQETDLFELATVDSVQFYYSGNRAGAVPLEWLRTAVSEDLHVEELCKLERSMKFDSARAIHTNDMALTHVYKQRMDANENITLHIREKAPNTSRPDSIVCTYLNNRLVDKVHGKQRKYHWHYNAKGLLDTSCTPSSIHPTTDTAIYEYDANNNDRLAVIKKGADPVCGQKLEYSDYLYNSAGKREAIVRMGYWSSQPDTISMETYTYNSAGQVGSMDLFFISNLNNLQNYERREYTYDNTGRPTGELYYFQDLNTQLLELRGQYIYTYSSAGLPQTAEQQLWDASANSWIPWKRVSIVYELAWPLSVANEQVSVSSITIYPSPAHDNINIQITFTQPQSITASITDMQGRLMRSWNEPSTKEYRRTIPVGDLPAGNYVLKVNNVAKQFVVR